MGRAPAPLSRFLARIAGDPCDIEDEEVPCEDGDGTVSCYGAGDSEGNVSLEWSACVVGECSQGESQPCRNLQGENGAQWCEVDDEGQSTWSICHVSGSWSTPLVLAFDDASVRFTQAEGGFSVDPGMSVATDWVSASTPWLALDRNRNGLVDGGNELFGSATPMGEGFAAHGFDALADLDENGDGRISGPELDTLLVWSDADQDRVSDPSEMVSAAAAGVVEIELAFANGDHCDARGNCEMLPGRFSFTSNGRMREGRVVDVTPKHQ